MTEYDTHADSYDTWSVADHPYRAVEAYTFMNVVGSVRGLDILDLGSGEGRTCRTFVERGARSVVGTDVSPEMVRRAKEKNVAPDGTLIDPQLRFEVVDARDGEFTLDEPVDLVTAMYLLHYASTEAELEQMCRLIARNLKPGGRFVTYGANPDYDFAHPDPRERELGATVRPIEANRCELAIGDMRVDFWQWSRSTHESCLRRAGLDAIAWHPLEADPTNDEVRASLGWYLANPPCIVLSARSAR